MDPNHTNIIFHKVHFHICIHIPTGKVYFFFFFVIHGCGQARYKQRTKRNSIFCSLHARHYFHTPRNLTVQSWLRIRNGLSRFGPHPRKLMKTRLWNQKTKRFALCTSCFKFSGDVLTKFWKSGDRRFRLNVRVAVWRFSIFLSSYVLYFQGQSYNMRGTPMMNPYNNDTH